MKLLLLFFFSTSLALLADLPRKRNAMELKALWDNSPFTSKPEVAEEKNQLEDWSLAGVSSAPGGGYMVTIVNKRDRTDRRRVQSSGQYAEENVNGYKILEVSQEGYNYRNTKVKLSLEGQEGWVSYDEKLLAIKPSVPAVRTNRPTNTPQIKPAKPNSAPPSVQNTTTTSSSASRSPRIRRVTPPPTSTPK